MGMTPAQAIVAATKNGALACKALDKFGTLQAGKSGDVLLLGAIRWRTSPTSGRWRRC